MIGMSSRRKKEETKAEVLEIVGDEDEALPPVELEDVILPNFGLTDSG